GAIKDLRLLGLPNTRSHLKSQGLSMNNGCQDAPSIDHFFLLYNILVRATA
ncbi:hypothetical protein AX16_001934, partial [Volvariella volvacea WC 439]